jgi:hypothetical protein
MAYERPEDLTEGYRLIIVIYNGGEDSRAYAYGVKNNGDKDLFLRWNGGKRKPGFPYTRNGQGWLQMTPPEGEWVVREARRLLDQGDRRCHRAGVEVAEDLIRRRGPWNGDYL